MIISHIFRIINSFFVVKREIFKEFNAHLYVQLIQKLPLFRDFWSDFRKVFWDFRNFLKKFQKNLQIQQIFQDFFGNLKNSHRFQAHRRLFFGGVEDACTFSLPQKRTIDNRTYEYGKAKASPFGRGGTSLRVTERGRDIMFWRDKPSQSRERSTARPLGEPFCFIAFRADDRWSPLQFKLKNLFLRNVTPKPQNKQI